MIYQESTWIEIDINEGDLCKECILVDCNIHPKAQIINCIVIQGEDVKDEMLTCQDCKGEDDAE